ncbi:MAG TPA: leucyl aminopeptidase [Burkholderiaceae bacterium]|nr:leucyl aminopeptidase [Burkholderiaceae bacterium]
MDVQRVPLGPEGLDTFTCDALLVLVGTTSGASSSSALQCLCDEVLKAGDLDASESGATLSIYRPSGLAARRLVLAAAGGGSADEVRKAVQAGWGQVKAAKPATLLIASTSALKPESACAALTAAADASYCYTTTVGKPRPRTLTSLALATPEGSDGLDAAIRRARALIAGVELAKEWANRPANHATPRLLADAARDLARRAGSSVKCQVLREREIEDLGMGAFLAVARGSHEPPRFIVLRYEGSKKREAPVVLVGKGITFDTGGISIKPAPEMDEMKFDMSGAASVLGAFEAIARLKPALNVVGLIPACENMPDGRAVKPGDVVKSMSGQTIEILNTDAEGRLILCDALHYAARYKPRAIVDIATLTGACVIALGACRSGLFSNDDALATALFAAGESSQDLCWRMPLDAVYAEGLRSHFADVANVAGRPGGAVTAAKFLERFVPAGAAWAHLDIAGTAWKGGQAKGATGRPVSLLVQYLLALAEERAESVVKTGSHG